MSSMLMVVPPSTNHPFVPQVVVYRALFQRLTQQHWGVGQYKKKTFDTMSKLACKLSQLNDAGPVPDGEYASGVN